MNKYKEEDERNNRYYTALHVHRMLKTKTCSAVILYQIKGGYQANFEDAAVVSNITGVPVKPDWGFVKCFIGASIIETVIKAIHVKEGRSVAIVEDKTIFMHHPKQTNETSAADVDQEELVIA
jgi:hypothetical protein